MKQPILSAGKRRSVTDVCGGGGGRQDNVGNNRCSTRFGPGEKTFDWVLERQPKGWER